MDALKFDKSKRTKKQLAMVNAVLPVDNKLKTLVFSNFPICLDKKKGIYSNYISFKNLTTNSRDGFFFPPGCAIYIDEAQKYMNVRSKNTFEHQTGVMLQHHRHAGINRIIFVSQDPLRLDIIIRNISESYSKIVKSFFIWGIGYMRINTYYRIDDYGKPCPRKKMFSNEPVNPLPGGYYDYDSKTIWFFTKPIFDAFDSTYFRFVFNRLPLLKYKSFDSKSLTQQQLTYLGIDDNLV